MKLDIILISQADFFVCTMIGKTLCACVRDEIMVASICLSSAQNLQDFALQASHRVELLSVSNLHKCLCCSCI